MKNISGEKQHVPVAISNESGDYSFLFELDGAIEFALYFDAREQGYKARYLDISYLLESELFQYSGNNPVIANAILIPDRIEVQTEASF